MLTFIHKCTSIQTLIENNFALIDTQLIIMQCTHAVTNSYNGNNNNSNKRILINNDNNICCVGVMCSGE
jgi:hypothetical protein